VVQVLPSYTPIKPELAQKIVLTTYLSGVNRNAIQRVVDTMKDVGVLKANVNLDDLIAKAAPACAVKDCGATP
jgi:hypothetical protein